MQHVRVFLQPRNFNTRIKPGGDTTMQKISAAGFLLLLIVLWLLFGSSRRR
jgi:hypothetical protein